MVTLFLTKSHKYCIHFLFILLLFNPIIFVFMNDYFKRQLEKREWNNLRLFAKNNAFPEDVQLALVEAFGNAKSDKERQDLRSVFIILFAESPSKIIHQLVQLFAEQYPCEALFQYESDISNFNTDVNNKHFSELLKIAVKKHFFSNSEFRQRLFGVRLSPSVADYLVDEYPKHFKNEKEWILQLLKSALLSKNVPDFSLKTYVFLFRQHLDISDFSDLSLEAERELRNYYSLTELYGYYFKNLKKNKDYSFVVQTFHKALSHRYDSVLSEVVNSLCRDEEKAVWLARNYPEFFIFYLSVGSFDGNIVRIFLSESSAPVRKMFVNKLRTSITFDDNIIVQTFSWLNDDELVGYLDFLISLGTIKENFQKSALRYALLQRTDCPQALEIFRQYAQ